MYRIYLIWKKFVCSQVLHSHLYYGKEAPCPPLQLYYNCIRGRRPPAPLYNCITIVLEEGGPLPPPNCQPPFLADGVFLQVCDAGLEIIRLKTLITNI